MSSENLPLSGVRVIEMTHMVMGPTCGMILAQLGAEVIKVEPPAGDKTRTLGGMGTSFFPLFNRGKRSVVLDFAKPEDRETMHRLLASADVFLENFRDGQLEKQGLGTDELRRKYPHLIVAGHKGFLSGPYQHRPALDAIAAAEFRRFLKSEILRYGQTSLLFASHTLPEVELLADRVAVMDAGRLLACEAPSTLKLKTGASSLEEAFFRLTGHGAAAPSGDRSP